MTLFAREERQIDPTLPANFPWSSPFHAGFFGALFQPEKSIFLFDPLLLLTILLLVLLWKRLTPGVRAYGISSLLLLLAYISFYARYTYWSGDFAWGDRYVSTTVEFVTLISVPLLLRYRERFRKNDLGRGIRADREVSPGDSSGVAGFLATARNLPDGDAWGIRHL